MVSTDFEYDNRCLSDYGFIICDFDYSDGVNEVDAGSVLTFNKIPINSGSYFGLSSTQYDNCITPTFDICKDPDMFEIQDRAISEDEYDALVRWLNRKKFIRICFLNHFPLCYLNASFNISKIIINGELYGLRLNMETDKPYGYGELLVTEKTFTNIDTTCIVKNKSQELGYIYPTLEIKCTESGTVTITNETIGKTVQIKNCIANEVITIDGEKQIIQSSIPTHKITNDFNYEFLPLQAELNETKNTITATPCKLTIKYYPIIKNIQL